MGCPFCVESSYWLVMLRVGTTKSRALIRSGQRVAVEQVSRTHEQFAPKERFLACGGFGFFGLSGSDLAIER